MKVVHVLLAGASRYDRSCAAIDLAIGPSVDHVLFEATPRGWLRNGTPSSLDELSAFLRAGTTSLLHVHGSTQPPRQLLRGLAIPWICDRRLSLPRSFFRPVPPPAAVLAEREIPEAAGDEWFVERQIPATRNARKSVGSFARSDGTRNNAEQASARIQRFRDDVEWVVYDAPPCPDELARLDLWVDPATGDDDIDGMVVEAVACLTTVVAAKTARNASRLDEGRAGVLPPAGDHNEMAHAVLNVLFKDEVAAPLRLHANRIRDRFRPSRRRDAIESVYREITR